MRRYACENHYLYPVFSDDINNSHYAKTMKTKTIELKSGIVIIDSRNLGIGVRIENQHTKYMTLNYSSSTGFYLNMKGFWLTEDALTDYYTELETMKQSLIEANTLLNQESGG